MRRKFSMLLIALLACSMVLSGVGPVSYAIQIDNGVVLTSVAYNGDSDNPVYITVGAGGVMYRSNGSDLSADNWVKIQASSILDASGTPLNTFTANMNGVVYDPDDGIFVAGGQFSTILVSADNGLTWNDQSASLRAASGGRAVWGLSYNQLSNGTKVFISVHPTQAPVNSEQAFVGQWNGTGFTWAPLSLSPNNAHSIAWNGDKLLIGSASSQGARGIIHYFDFEGYSGGTPPVSPTGTSATHFNPYPGDTVTGNVKPINGLTWFQSKWIAVTGNGGSGNPGGIYFSTTVDGIPSGTDDKWAASDFHVRQASDYPAQLFSVASSESAVVAVGSAGTILHSTDGIHYTKQNSGTDADLRSVIYDGNRFVAVGAKGQLVWSPDGEDWSYSIPEPYAYTGKMDGNQMLLDLTFESLDFTKLNEIHRYIPPKDPGDQSNTPPIAISQTGFALYDHSAAGNLQATTVKLALNDEVYMQPAVSQPGSALAAQMEPVVKHNGATNQGLRIQSSGGAGNAVLGFGFHNPQQGTIVLEVDVYYPQPNEAGLPRLYAESGVPIDTHDHLASLVTSTSMPYFQFNPNGSATITGGQVFGHSLKDGNWRRLKFSVDTETGQVSAVIYRVDGRYAQDYSSYAFNTPGNISYSLENGLIHLGFAADSFGHEGVLIDNLKIYREVYYKNPVKPASISVMQLDGKYYQYAVDRVNRVIKPRSSDDMLVWKDEPDIQLHGSWAEWNQAWHDFWAVEMYKFNGKYYMTYSAKKDTTLLNESFDSLDFTSLPELYRNPDSWSTVVKHPHKLELTDTGASGDQHATTIELELNYSVGLKPSLHAAGTEAQLNVELVTVPRGANPDNKVLHIYNDSEVDASNVLSFVLNANYARGEMVFEADVLYLGGADRRIYLESSVPLVTGDHLAAITDGTSRPYLEFGSAGAAVMSGGQQLGSFNLADTWYRLELRVNSETGRVTAAIRDETGSQVLASGQYTFNPADHLKNGVFHVGFADSQLGTGGMLIDNVKIWSTDDRSFHRLGIAESDSISGPFTDLGRPLLDSHAAIDSHIFQDTDGKFYLYYAKDVSGNVVVYNGSEERQSQIYGVEMNSDLRSIKGTPVLLSSPTEPYERKTSNLGMYWNEAPWVHKHNDTYYLFYSTNLFNSMYYNLAYSTSDHPLGAYTKYPHNPIAQTDGLYPNTVLRGLGHNSIVSSPDGSELYITYVPNQGDGSTGNTAVPFENMGSYFDRMGFRTDGTVYVNGPTFAPQPLPSGINGYANLARSAVLTASSTKPGYSLERLIDGEIGIYTKFADLYEWMSNDQRAGAWVQLDWPQPKTLTSVAVYDSAAPQRKLASGRLTFSNGTIMDVTFPDEHGAAAIATFPPMEASWVKFEVTEMLGTGYAGLSEIVVLGRSDNDTTAPITTDNAPAGWMNTDVAVTLSAANAGSGAANAGSGAAATYYSVNGGPIQSGNLVWITTEGVNTLAYWSVDHAGNVEEVKQTVIRIDKTPPVLVVELDKTILSPPNHQLIPVTASVYASDALSQVDSVVLTSIISNEPDNGSGDGNTTNDIQEAAFGTYDTNFLLRAERSGQGTGRVYTITYTATDQAGNQTTASATVTVPHHPSGNRRE